MSVIGRVAPFLVTAIAAVTFATWSTTDKGSSVSLSGGNLTATQTSTAGMVRATVGKSSGKWYWEIKPTSTQNNVGVAKATASLSNYVGGDANGWGLYSADGKVYNNNAGGPPYTTYGNGDTLGFALDMDAGTLTLYKNGSLIGVIVTGLTGTIYPAWGNAGSADSCVANFGAAAFDYTPPSGYYPGLPA
ncbi:MAG: SPRY domain-containing protein [Rhodoferax sp.]